MNIYLAFLHNMLCTRITSQRGQPFFLAYFMIPYVRLKCVSHNTTCLWTHLTIDEHENMCRGEMSPIMTYSYAWFLLWYLLGQTYVVNACLWQCWQPTSTRGVHPCQAWIIIWKAEESGSYLVNLCPCKRSKTLKTVRPSGCNT